MGLGDGRRMNGTSSLDKPTGSRKYSMAAPSAGERAAKADRMDQAASDRMLSKTMRDSSQPASVRIAAAKEQQNRRDTPGYINGRGIRDAEQNRNQDSQTADNFTKEGLRLQGKQNSADVVAGQADAVNKNVGVATADGGTNSKIGTSTADGGNSKLGTSQADTPTSNAKPSISATNTDKYGPGSAQPRSNLNYIPERDGASTGEVGTRVDGYPAAPAGGTRITPPTTDENGLVSAPSEPVGQGAPVPATTPPVAQGGAGKGKPAPMEWETKRKNAIEEQANVFKRQKLGKDLLELGRAPVDKNRKNPEEHLSGTPNDELYAYGESLGITKDQMLKQIDKGVASLSKNTGKGDSIDPLYQASNDQLAEPQTDSRMPTLSAKEPTPEEAEKSRLEESRRSFSEKFPSLGDENINAMKALADKIKSPSAKSPEQIEKEETSRQSAEYRKTEIEIADKEQESRKSRIAYLDGVAQNLEYGSKEHTYDDMATGVTGNRIISKTNDSLKKEARSPDQASIDNKLQQRAAAYQAPINEVRERSNFLQRYA